MYLARRGRVLINRPDLIQDVLVNHPGRFMKSRILQRAKQMIGEGLLTSEGQFHLRQREDAVAMNVDPDFLIPQFHVG